MGGLARQLQRRSDRRAYEAFSSQWRETRRDQSSRLASGEGLKEGEPEFGPRPTFEKFLQLRERVRARVTAQVAEKRRQLDEAAAKLEWPDPPLSVPPSDVVDTSGPRSAAAGEVER